MSDDKTLLSERGAVAHLPIARPGWNRTVPGYSVV
jgi:hypothetical protein